MSAPQVPSSSAAASTSVARSPHASAVRPGVEEKRLGRTFTVHQDGSWTLSGEAVALASPASARLLLPLGKAMSATSDSVLADDPAVSAMFAVDGRPDTSWLAAAGDEAPSIDLSWSTPRRIDRIQLSASLVAARTPYEVDIEAGGQHRTVHRALGEPELVPVHPEAVVQRAAVFLAASRATMLPRAERIELEQRAVAGTATALAREERFLARKIDLVLEHAIEIGGQRSGERRERSGGDHRAIVQRLLVYQNAHRAATVDDGDGAISHWASVGISPRRSMRTLRRRAERPWMPREW